MVTENSPAPAFTLLDETGTPRSLAEYLGKPVVLYFYPADDTPGCTKEACSFRDDYGVYEQAGIVILGVSPDSPRSHAKFKAKYNLPFTLLADDGHQVCDLYGVWGDKKLWGHEYEGVLRTTFLIDEHGMVKKIFPNVKPNGHSAEVLAALKD
ncbi:MAG: thioredoxin-dependent thiol peroxidase [Bellilinea sp.]